MIAENGISHEDVDDLDTGQSGKITERGCYGQALREGWVRKPPPKAPRTVNMPLWVFNVVCWLLLVGFVAWRLYAVYFVGGA